MLARLQYAADLGKAGKTAEAVAAYDAVAGETGIETAVGDIARIRAAYLLADTASPAELAKRVATLNVGGQPVAQPGPGNCRAGILPDPRFYRRRPAHE